MLGHSSIDFAAVLEAPARLSLLCLVLSWRRPSHLWDDALQSFANCFQDISVRNEQMMTVADGFKAESVRVPFLKMFCLGNPVAFTPPEASE
jgi:hypothetical protein